MINQTRTTVATTTMTTESNIPNRITQNKLVELPPNDLPKLRDLYGEAKCLCNNSIAADNNRTAAEAAASSSTEVMIATEQYSDDVSDKCWSHNQLGYQTIANYIEWLHPAAGHEADERQHTNKLKDFDYQNQQGEVIDSDGGANALKIYSLNNDWSTDGLFLVIDNHQIIYNTLCSCVVAVGAADRLKIALNLLHIKTSGLLIIFNGIAERLLPPIRDWMRENCLQPNHRLNCKTLWYCLPNCEAKRFTVRLPTGLRFGGLLKGHASLINQHWSWKHQGSERIIKNLIKFNANVGVFDDSGNLIGWCLRQQIGALGVLFVMPSHRSLGIGRMLVERISKCIAESSPAHHICASVLESNLPSRRLFEGLGFRVVDKVNWIALDESVQ